MSMDIPIRMYCIKYRKEEKLYINVVDGVPYPNICDNGDGSDVCRDCLKRAVEKHQSELLTEPEK